MSQEPRQCWGDRHLRACTHGSSNATLTAVHPFISSDPQYCSIAYPCPLSALSAHIQLRYNLISSLNTLTFELKCARQGTSDRAPSGSVQGEMSWSAAKT